MTNRFILLVLLVVVPVMVYAASLVPAEPYRNSFLADSVYPMPHPNANLSNLPGPVGPSRRLRKDEILWKPDGFISWGNMYSGPYPNGQRVIWVGGYDRLEKLDANTLAVLSTYAFGGKYSGDEEIERNIATMDRLDDTSRLEYTMRLWEEPFKSTPSGFYRLISRDNELYMPYRGRDGGVRLQVYGDADPNDPTSEIRMKREWIIPPQISTATPLSVVMTSDGWIAMVMYDGTLIVTSRDLHTQHFIKLPRTKITEGADNDIFSTFVRNGIVTDDRGGIYIVTRDYLNRVQWTGEKLSLDETDSGWSLSYPNDKGIGSGTTPGLMGWGPNEDHLVVIADASPNNNAIAFWRDKIPDDWKGLPGYPRRVAGITPIHFGVSKTEQVQIENSPVIDGYGVFFDNTYPERRLAQKTPSKQWMSDSLLMNVPGHEALGGTKLRWNPRVRELETAWQSQTNFVSSVCTVSRATNVLYCWGARNREWTIEGVDWQTGKGRFHYTLGESHRFNIFGGPVIVAPNGAIDCGCAGGLGIVRVSPKAKP